MGDNSKKPGIRFKGFTDDWEQRKLGEVLSLLKDGTHGTHQDAEEGPYLLSAKNIKNGQIIIDDSSDRKISEDEFNQIHTKFTLENGDILLTIVGSIGESAILENVGKFTFQRSVAFLRPSEEMTSRFLKTEIESVQFQKELNDRKSQSAQPGVYLGDLSKIPIYITSKEEQKKIGECFSNLDHLITLHQRKYDKLVVIKKSMLEKMFPKNGQTKPEIRFSGFTDDWEQRKLGEVLSLLKDGTHGTHQDAEEGPYLLSAKNIKNGQIIIDDSSDRKISEDEFNQIHTKFTLENGDILLTIVGSIGESAILENVGKFTFQRSVAFLRPSEEMTSRFLKTEIESVQFQKELNDRKSQSAQPGVYLGDLSKIPIYITSKEEQKKIGECFSNLDHLITLHQRELEKLKKIKLSMLEKMFV